MGEHSRYLLFRNPSPWLRAVSPADTLLCLLGQFGSQRVAGDLGLCWGPGRHQGSGHQCWAGDDGARGQGFAEAGERESDGGVEILHLLWVPGVSIVVPVRLALRKTVEGDCGYFVRQQYRIK